MPRRSRRRATPPRSERELQRFSVIVGESLGFPPYDEGWAGRYDQDDVRLVRRDGEVAAGLVVLRFGQWFGGAVVPMAGIHAVAVATEYRGTGAGTVLMRSVVEELHEQGVPISTLFPATQPIYRSVGYEQAGSWTCYSVPIASIDLRDRSLEIDRVAGDGLAALRAVYERRARAGNGNLDRNDWAWQRAVAPQHVETTTFAVRGESGVEGYVAFSRSKIPGQVNRFDIRVRDLVALTPAAGRRILTLIADHRSLGRNLRWFGAPADPLQLLLREQADDSDGHSGVVHQLRWMVRLTHARNALAARGYPAGVRARIDFDIRDDLLPDNAGRLVLEVDDGAARVRKGGRGTLRIDARGLAALYTGHLDPHALATAGLCQGTDEILARTAPVFAGPPPWMPEIF